MPNQSNNYELARRELIYQLGYLISQIAGLPLPADNTVPVKEWLMREAWLMEESIWDSVEETIKDAALVAR